MKILGIADNHDSGAALVVDGELVAAVNQERLDRIKGSAAFPWSAIDAVLDIAGVKAREVDQVVFGSGYTPSLGLRMLPEIHRSARTGGQFSKALHAYLVYQSVLRSTGLDSFEVDLNKAWLMRKLKERPFGAAQLTMMDHHQAHAHCAYRTQPRDRCLVVTLDAMGDGTCASVSVGESGQLHEQWRQSGLTTVGTFFGRVTEMLGFRANRHEGKVSGLAAFAEPPTILLDQMRAAVGFSNGRFRRLSITRPARPTDPPWSTLTQWSREEVSAAAQRVLEEVVSAYVSHWVEKTGCGDVVLAGGIFANVKLNRAIACAPNVDSVWIAPHMGDGGLPVGAALGAAESAPRALPHAYLGPDFSVRDAYKAIERGALPHKKFAEPKKNEVGKDVERVAELLAGGAAIASVQGRMEWGPRALGNRSVLVRANDPSIAEWLNDKLQRDRFMPFAPVIREEEASEFFTGMETVDNASQFMTVCVDATDRFKKACPGAVHIDGTVRPQVVTFDSNPRLHALLGAYGRRTGVPVLINTSFNMHEEPLVCTVSDAVRAFKTAQLDALWMGPFVAERE